MKLKNFSVKEFVSEYTYSLHGEKSIQLMSSEIIDFMEFFHGFCSNHFGGKCSIVINDWSWRKGGFQYRGLRDVNYYTDNKKAQQQLDDGDEFEYMQTIIDGLAKYNKSRSRHKCGMCTDFDVYIDGVRIEPLLIRKLIIDNYQREGFENIRFIEDGVNWVHVSVEPSPWNILTAWHVKTGEAVTYPREL